MPKASANQLELPNVTPLQADFVLASQRARTRRARWVVAITVAIVLVLSMLTVYAFQQAAEAKRQEGIAREKADKERIARDSAEEQARIAESRRLAAESSSALAKYPQRSLLLAVEAVKVEQPLHGARVVADEQSLREALGFIGGRLLATADGAITAVAISPDNRWLVTGSCDETARLWDLSANDPAAKPVVLRGHKGVVWAVAISPDSRWLVTGSQDKTARLWDLRAKDPAANPVILRGLEDLVSAVAISPDNRWVVTGSSIFLSSSGAARLWLLQMNDLVDLARTIVARNFVSDEWQLYFPGEKYRKTFPDLPGPELETPKNN